MSEKKILFIAYLYPPVGGTGLPGVQRTVKFLRYLSYKNKYVLTLKTDLYPDFLSLENKTSLPVNNEVIIRSDAIDLFKILLKAREFFGRFLKKNSLQTDKIVSESYISEISQISDNKKSLSANIKDFISEMLTIPDYAYAWIIPAINSGKKIVNSNDVIFATGLPWTSLLVGWIIKTLTGAKFIADFRDPWIGNTFAPVNKGRLRKIIEKYLEKKIVINADIISLNTEELRNAFIKRYDFLPKDKFITLTNGYDENDFKDIKIKQAQKKDKLLLTHTGFLYGVRSPKPILEPIYDIKKTDAETAEKILFRQIGKTELNDDIKGFIIKNSLQNNYKDLKQLPFNQCLQYMAESDILVIIQQGTKTQIPSKIYEYIYLNKPVLTIAQKDGALGKMIIDYKFGDIFEPDDKKGLADYLIEKVMEKEKYGIVKADYKHREKFDVRNIAKQLEKIIEKSL